MNDRVEGGAREMGGRVQEKFGEAIGDAKTQASGLYNQAMGQAEQRAEQVSDVIREQPILSALVAIGIGYLLGRLTS